MLAGTTKAKGVILENTFNSFEVPSGSSRDKVKLDPEQEHLRWLICHIAPRTTKTSMQKKKTGG